MFASFHLSAPSCHFQAHPSAMSSSLCLIIPSCQLGCLRKVVFTHTGTVVVAQLPPVWDRAESLALRRGCAGPRGCVLGSGTGPACGCLSTALPWRPGQTDTLAGVPALPREPAAGAQRPEQRRTRSCPSGDARSPDPPSCPHPPGSEAPATSSTTAGSQEAGHTSWVSCQDSCVSVGAASSSALCSGGRSPGWDRCLLRWPRCHLPQAVTAGRGTAPSTVEQDMEHSPVG